MRWQELSVATTKDAREAVADLFYQAGAQGVVIEDPHDYLRYMEEGKWEYFDIPPDKLAGEEVVLKAYLPFDTKLPCRVEEFTQSLNDLAQYFEGLNCKVSISEIAEEDWANAWKTYYKPEKIGNKVIVVPSWEEYKALEGEVAVVLDPGMAFGTGTHPTTAMCVRALEKYLKPAQTMIDVGTGSGILAVTAALLGAVEVLAVDQDPVAVRTAGENVLMNKVESCVSVCEGDLLKEVEGQVDLITANIVANVITELAPQASNHLGVGGTFIASGIIRQRLADVELAILKAGLCLVEIIQQGDWVTLISMKEDVS